MPLSRIPDGFIPTTRPDLVQALLSSDIGTGLDPDAFAQLSHWLARLTHIEFFEIRERLKTLYRPFDPDRMAAASGDGADLSALLDSLDTVMTAANYRPLAIEDLEQVDHRRGRLGARIQVSDEMFDNVRFYARGRTRSRITVKTWFGLRKREIEAITYDQVLFAAHIKPDTPKKLLDRWRLRPGAVYLKHFGDIARGDLQTLYPTARMAMPVHYQLMMGIPALFAGVPLLLKIIPQITILLVFIMAYFGISGTLEDDSLKKALAAAAGLGALGGFLGRQWTTYDRYDLRNQKEVIENAYYNKLGSNRGAFDTLISAAEEAEVKEALLAYAFLRSDSSSAERLTQDVEAWVLTHFGAEIAFDTQDALDLLARLGLTRHQEAIVVASSLEDALKSCKIHWRKEADRISGSLIA